MLTMKPLPVLVWWGLLTFSLLEICATTRADSPNAAALAARYRKEKAPVWADGDTATFFYRGKANQVSVTFAGYIRRLNRLANSDVWTLTVHLPDLKRGVFEYGFLPSAKKRPSTMVAPAAGVWRGPQAPAPAAECTVLRGTLRRFDVNSRALGERRAVTVYLPPGHDSRKPSRVIYATDGENLARYAHVLEPLITTGRIPPTVLVGAYSGGYLGGAAAFQAQKYDPQKDLRAQEYFPGLNAKRFSAHAAFFCTELPLWAEKHFGVSHARQDRIVFGYSNGGRFAAEMGIHDPKVFGSVFAFSVAGNGKFDFGETRKDLPRFYLTAGTWDTHFHRCTARLAEQLRQRGVRLHFSSRVAGHDAALWRDEFAAAVRWANGHDAHSR